MSALALFGNTSWIHAASKYAANMTYDTVGRQTLSWQLMCAGLPFRSLFHVAISDFPEFIDMCRWDDEKIVEGYETRDRDLLDLMHAWFSGFAPQGSTGRLNTIEGLLEIGMFVSNRALLTFYSPEQKATDTLSILHLV